MFREQGELYGLGLALAGAAATAVSLGDRGRAEELAREALALVNDASGMPEVESRVRTVLAPRTRSR